jgi:Fic family protein
MGFEPHYTRITQMEPMFPDYTKGPNLSELVIEVIRKSSALSSTLHPLTRQGVVELVRSMNSYYSNQIEGHHTHPADIEKALAKDYSQEPAKRAMQMESASHIEVQRLIEHRLKEEPRINICSTEFLCWVHKEFYDRLPEEFLFVDSKDGKKEIIPGELRKDEVTVGRHLAPASSSLPSFLERFNEVYGNTRLGQIEQIVAAAASHHRLAWIHPFSDGNGRVTRLFSHAYLIKTRIDGHGLWTISRGLARNRDAYIAALAGADEHRQGDLDGRGNLSNKGLLNFCGFFLEIALDQVEFMSSLLELDAMKRRISGYVERQVRLGELQEESIYLLSEVFLNGEIQRGEASRITGKPERTARRILKDLLEKSLLISDSEKGPVRLAFPVKIAAYYFPRLYPEGVEAEML